MKTKTDAEWNNILTKEALFEEYCVKRKNIFIIAQEFQCGVLRIKDKLKEYSLNRKRVAHNRRISNKDKIERMGFKFIGEYIGTHEPTKIICYCGSEFISRPHHLLSGHTKSCGCSFNKRPINFTGYEEISGKEFKLIYAGAKRRNIEFSITIEQLWSMFIAQNKKCKLTGLNLKWNSKNGYGNASVDRIDNLKGYTIDNVQIIHKDVNMMKRHHSQDYLIYISKLIAKNNHEGKYTLWETQNLL